MSSDSIPLISLEQSTSFIDVKHSLVVSTNSIEGTELLSIKTKSLTTSPSFIHFIRIINQSNYFQDHFYFILFYSIMVQPMNQMYQSNKFKIVIK